MCTKKEKLTRNNTDFEDQLQFVSDAVMAFAYALRYVLKIYVEFYKKFRNLK